MYVLGYLDIGDTGMLPNTASLLEKLDCGLPTFDDIYFVCGGSMFLMNLFCQEYCEENGRGLIGKDPSGSTRVMEIDGCI